MRPFHPNHPLHRAIIRLVGSLSFIGLVSGCGNEKPPSEPKNDTTVVTTTTPSATESSQPPAPAPAPVSSGHGSPQSVVDAYLAAAKAGDKAAMLDLFVPESVENQKNSKKAFTHAISELGLKVVSFELAEPLKEDGDKAEVRYRARFTKDGKEDKESMRFELVKKDGGWKIVDIH